MDEPLGRCVGNFLEVRESVACLRGEGPEDLTEIVVRLTAWMLLLGGVSPSLDQAETLCRKRLKDGSAYERFIGNVRFQGGDPAVIEAPETGPRASLIRPLTARRAGYIQEIDAYGVGMAATHLGAGRLSRDDRVLPTVGIELLRRRGESVHAGEDLCVIHAEDESRYERACSLVEKAFVIADRTPGPAPPIIREELCGGKNRS
jgi:thymidine phosphorylase